MPTPAPKHVTISGPYPEPKPLPHPQNPSLHTQKSQLITLHSQQLVNFSRSATRRPQQGMSQRSAGCGEHKTPAVHQCSTLCYCVKVTLWMCIQSYHANTANPADLILLATMRCTGAGDTPRAMPCHRMDQPMLGQHHNTPISPPPTAPVVTVVCPMCLILYNPGICEGWNMHHGSRMR